MLEAGGRCQLEARGYILRQSGCQRIEANAVLMPDARGRGELDTRG